MAFENIFIRVPNKIGSITLDAVIEESHGSPVRLTTNPVEEGVDITDHAIIEPKTLSMRAVVSDNPLGIAAFTKIVDDITGLFGSSTSENNTRSNQAYSALVTLQEARQPLEIITSLLVYTDMFITDINTIRDKDTSKIVFMDITFEEVLITSSEIITLSEEDLASGATQKQAASKTELGRKEPVEPSAGAQSSVLKKLIKFVGG